MAEMRSAEVASPCRDRRRCLPGAIFSAAPALLAFLAIVMGGCTNAHYRKSADRETAAIIAQKSPAVPNMDPHFTIEETNVLSLEGLPVVIETEEALGRDGEAERGARIISLDAALSLAVKHSRIYQLSKEQLYLQGLALTLARHQFAPIFSGRAQSDFQTVTEEVRVVVDALTGQPKVVSAGEGALVEQHRITGQTATGVSILAATGARLATAFTTDFLRYLTGDPRTFTSSQVAGTIIQPLWRGAGYKATMENLTQAERSFLYALRDFSRFRRDFTLQVTTAYYGVLQNRDSVRNNWRGLQNFRRNVERERALSEEGLRTQASLGLLKQNELATETTWINAIRNYKQSLDQFKIQIGLTTDADVTLDDAELSRLQISHPALSVEDAQEVALNARLDYYNSRDQVEDTARKISVAANGLRPQIDLVAGGGFTSRPGQRTLVPIPDPERYHWNAGLNVDLPFDRKAQRNTYRAAIIAYEQSRRALQQTEDQIKLQLRNDWRNLDQAKRNYEIAEIGVDLAARRVQEQDLRAELGRSTAREQVDAQNDLISQKNLRTQALIGHTVARLQFWNDMGILFIGENGKWEDANVKESVRQN